MKSKTKTNFIYTNIYSEGESHRRQFMQWNKYTHGTQNHNNLLQVKRSYLVLNEEERKQENEKEKQTESRIITLDGGKWQEVSRFVNLKRQFGIALARCQHSLLLSEVQGLISTSQGTRSRLNKNWDFSGCCNFFIVNLVDSTSHWIS